MIGEKKGNLHTVYKDLSGNSENTVCKALSTLIFGLIWRVWDPQAGCRFIKSDMHSSVIIVFVGESEQEVDLRATVLSLFLTALQCLLFSICASTPYLPLQYLTFVLQVLNRSFLYGGNAAFISVAWVSNMHANQWIVYISQHSFNTTNSTKYFWYLMKHKR